MTEVTATKPDAASESLRVEVASQWQLMWWKFRKHRLALPSMAIILLMYLTGALAEPLAPWASARVDGNYVSGPPQVIHLFWQGRLAPFVYGYRFERHPESMKRIFTQDKSKVIPIGLFVRGDPYKLWGLFRSDVHLLGPRNQGDALYLLGTDTVGRDVLSRLIYGARVSLTAGMVAVAMTFVLGILIGGISGLAGGTLDNLLQRLIEILNSIPRIPFWLACAAAVPPGWSPLRVYFMISMILALLNWTGLARVVRSKFLSLREEEFVLAAVLDGCSRFRLITHHMLPSFMSHIIASITLAIPGMILGETALSFLGLGLRPPIVSWGVMLQDTQRIVAIADYPWVLLPAAAVFITVLAFNFFGDGLRDAADPYTR